MFNVCPEKTASKKPRKTVAKVVDKAPQKQNMIEMLPQKLTDFGKRCFQWTKIRNNWLLLLLLFLLGFAVGAWRSVALRVQSPAASAPIGTSAVPQVGAKSSNTANAITGAQPLSELSSLMQRQTANFDAMLAKSISESNATSLVAVNSAEFVRPCPGRVTETFGWKRDASMGAWNLHAGVFLTSPPNASIVAIAGGQVARIEHDTLHGTLITIDHDSHWRSVYGHLSEIPIAAGDPVTVGQIIGRAGLGPEGAEGLYFAVYRDGEPQDPQMLIPGL